MPFTLGQPIQAATMESRNFVFQIAPLKVATRNPKISLAFRELEALARTLLSVFFSFFDAGIARYQPSLFQGRPQVRIEF